MAEDRVVRRAGPKVPGRHTRGADGSAPRVARPPRVKRVILASVGPPIPASVLDRLYEVASEVCGPADPVPLVHVVSIARIWGTALGLPNPGLYPNRIEIAEQREIVDSASAAVRRRGFEVKSRILSARNPAKAIALYAESIGASAIVVGDPAHDAKRWEHVLKGHDARDLGRRTKIPVYTVPIDEPLPQGIRRAPAQTRRRRTGTTER